MYYAWGDGWEKDSFSLPGNASAGLLVVCGSFTPAETDTPRRIWDRYYHFSDNIRLFYRTVGSGGQPLVFLHGFGASHRTWNPLVSRFDPRRFTLYLLDLKGFGLSSRPRDGKYNFPEQARIIYQFLVEQDLKNVILAGHSYGGGVTLLTALRDVGEPESPRISAIILMDAASYQQKPPAFVRHLRTPVLNFLMLHLTSPAFKSRYMLKRLVFNPEVITPEMTQSYAGFLDRRFFYVLRETARQIIPENFAQYTRQYPRISVPTLIIWGKADPILPLKNAQRLHRDLPRSRLVLLDKCGHIPQEERPAATFRAIMDFICHPPGKQKNP